VTEEARISQVIFEYASKIGKASGTDALLELNAAMARDLVGADRCSIWLIDPAANQLWTKVAHGVDELRVPLEHGVVGACIAERRPIVVNDTSKDPRFRGKTDLDTGYATRALLALPLNGADGRAIGAIQVLNKPGGFHDRDMNLLGLAAAYSASAIETEQLRGQAEAARLLQREIEIARAVQERLFPQHLPALAGWDCAAQCRPAKAVGGDYFDFIAMPGGGVLFTIGDVSGKGIAAAVLMAGIQASIRSQALYAPESLAALAGDFNKAFYSFSPAEKYSTLFCGLLDAGSRRLTYVNAGQVAPVVLGSGGGIELLEAGGPPVGLFPMTRYREATVELAPGDAVVCFSDGINEATNGQDEMWGDACLEVIRQATHLGAREIVEKLIAGADEFTGDAEQADDMTVVVLKAIQPAHLI
jgi:sigma-B regulation protein RsbU (phosphoserine phosphatase)